MKSYTDHDGKYTIGILLHTEEKSDFFAIKGRFVKYYESGKVRNFSSFAFAEKTPYMLNDVQVGCFGSSSFDTLEHFEVVVADTYSLKLEDLKQYVKTLGMIEKGIEKHRETFGIADFPSYVAVVAATVGAVILTTTGNETHYDYNNYRVMDSQDLRWYVKKAWSAWYTEHGKQTA